MIVWLSAPSAQVYHRETRVGGRWTGYTPCGICQYETTCASFIDSRSLSDRVRPCRRCFPEGVGE